jgi:hypothetical protein
MARVAEALNGTDIDLPLRESRTENLPQSRGVAWREETEDGSVSLEDMAATLVHHRISDPVAEEGAARQRLSSSAGGGEQCRPFAGGSDYEYARARELGS